MHRIKKMLSKRYPAVIWTLIILTLISIPGNMLPKEEGFSIANFDKYVHASLFLGFVLLWSIYYEEKPEPKGKYTALIILLIGCAYGVGTEYLQKYVIPRRDFDLDDIVADAIGSALGYFIFLRFRFLKRKKIKAGNIAEINKPL